MFGCFHWWLWRRKCRLGIKVNRHLTSLLSLRCLLWPHSSSLYFNGHFVAPRPTLVHYWGDSLTRPMLITAFLLFRPVGHREPLQNWLKIQKKKKKKKMTTLYNLPKCRYWFFLLSNLDTRLSFTSIASEICPISLVWVKPTTLLKVALLHECFSSFQMRKWYQIAQRTTFQLLRNRVWKIF